MNAISTIRARAEHPDSAPDAEYSAGPQCSDCDPCDPGCSSCCVETDHRAGERVGMRCGGNGAEACVVLGPRLTDGGYVLSSGRVCCADCAGRP